MATLDRKSTDPESPATVGYFLARNFLASARLTYQHQCLSARQGYLLHPSITTALGLATPSPSHSPSHNDSRLASPPLQILDLATGNAIWATDLAAAYRTSPNSKSPIHITCLDISDAQYPPPESRSSDTTFGIWDLFSPVPQEYIEFFDVIHIRFIISLLFQDPKRQDTVLSNVKLMLKPGGWLQWQEPPPPSYGQILLPPTSEGFVELGTQQLETAEAIDRYVPTQKSCLWMNDLHGFVRDAGGFADVDGHWVPMKLERAKYEGDLLVWVGEEVHEGLFGTGRVDEEGKKDIKGKWEKLLMEIKNGEVMMGMRLLVVVGKKI